MLLQKVRLAAAHLSPVHLNPALTLQKALSAIDTAAKAGASILAFPESFIPGFPLHLALSAPIDSGSQYRAWVESSLYIDGPEISAVREKCRQRNIVVSLGFSERSRRSVGCVWNSNAIIGEEGQLGVVHRKLQPTYWEKLLWSPGSNGHGLRTFSSPNLGQVGALICGENTNPLARFALMSQAETVHVASYPPTWPTTRGSSSPSSLSDQTNQNYDNRLANHTRTSAHSFEAKCFSIMVASHLDSATRDILSEGDPAKKAVLDQAQQAKTAFFGPDGRQIGEEAGSDGERIVYADVDLGKCVEEKRLHDVTGGYQRPDILGLKVDRRWRESADFIDDDDDVKTPSDGNSGSRET